MNCARYRQLISRYIDGEVTPRQRQELLAHVQTCHDCAAWLARARQTDVLLKGLNTSGPSDRVRSAILDAVRKQEEDSVVTPPPPPQSQPQPQPRPALAPGGLRLGAAGLLLRFDPHPRAIAMTAAATFVAMLSLGYWFNILPPIWGYDKIGFEVRGEAGNAPADVQPMPVYSGSSNVGSSISVPNTVRIAPAAGSADVDTGATLQMRFDQPMDRASVESALQINPPLAGTFRWSADNEVSFVPAQPGLLRGLTYTAVLGTGARSIAGTALEAPLTWSFETRSPHTVIAPSAGTKVALTGMLSLTFDAPMDMADATGKVSLHGPGGAVLPVSLTWDAEGRTLQVSPNSPMPEGNISLRIQASARTSAGDTLGKAYEFTYSVETSAPSLRLAGERVRVIPAGSTAPVSYTGSVDEAGTPLQRIVASVYRLPAERLSELGAQARRWPAQVPGGLLEGLERVRTFRSAVYEDSSVSEPVFLSGLPAGIYLLRAEAPTPLGTTSDWQLLVVADRSMTRLAPGSISALWATDEAGHAWNGAEVSLYAPDGSLLEKGATSETGLWQPSNLSAGASLAVARDLEGHLAALVLDPQTWTGLSEAQADNSLAASMQTDLPAYAPGQSLNFRVLLNASLPSSPATPSAEQDVTVQFRTPEGAVLSSLHLRPDTAGGVGGMFTLSPHARPGNYSVQVEADGRRRSFPVQVIAEAKEALSVYIVPTQEYTPSADLTLTRTVSVLTEGGQPAAGAAITGTLRIEGDTWASMPVAATTDRNGRATLTMLLPSWVALYNDPGLYLGVEADLGGKTGTDKLYLDFTPENTPRLELPQLVAPNMDLVAIARTRQDGTLAVRLVQHEAAGDGEAAGALLVTAESPRGDYQQQVIALAELRDVTINLPSSYAGGFLTLARAGQAVTRRLNLDVQERGEVTLLLQAPETVSPGEQVSLGVSLLDSEWRRMTGTASLWWRRLSDGFEPGTAQGWEPTVNLSASAVTSATLQAPDEPGLWQLISEVASPDGVYTRAWSLVRVAPGVAVQLPPPAHLETGNAGTFSVVLHNSMSAPANPNLYASANGSLALDGPSTQSVLLAPGSSGRLVWRFSAISTGSTAINFRLVTDVRAAIARALPVEATTGTEIVTTYEAGLLQGERQIAVYVPSGLRPGEVQLEIRASTSLLSAISQIAQELPATAGEPAQGVALSAARLSSAPAVESAFRRIEGSGRSELEQTAVVRSLLLQELYSAQRPDGGWGASLSSTEGTSEIVGTGRVLLAAWRLGITASSGEGAAIERSVLDKGLAYLLAELSRPVDEQAGPAALEERAFGMYVLSLYSQLDLDQARSLLQYAGSASKLKLTQAGQAWLALALWQKGAHADALVLANWLLQTQNALDTAALAPMLELSLAISASADAGTPDLSGLLTRRDAALYQAAAASYARDLMESRQGIGWADYGITADAVWALSLYAAQEKLGETPGRPSITINDRPVQLSQPASDSRANAGALDVDIVSILLAGDTLHAGTNWLTLKAPGTEQELYYSLTLKAKR